MWIEIVLVFFFVFGVIALSLISILLHELCHLLFCKIAGVRGRFIVKWIQFSGEDIGGYVQVQNARFSEFWKERSRLFGFLAGFSGGAGVSVIFLLILAISLRILGVERFQFVEPLGIAQVWFLLIIIMIGTNVLYAIYEGSTNGNKWDYAIAVSFSDFSNNRRKEDNDGI